MSQNFYFHNRRNNLSQSDACLIRNDYLFRHRMVSAPRYQQCAYTPLRMLQHCLFLQSCIDVIIYMIISLLGS